MITQNGSRATLCLVNCQSQFGGTMVKSLCVKDMDMSSDISVIAVISQFSFIIFWVGYQVLMILPPKNIKLN